MMDQSAANAALQAVCLIVVGLGLAAGVMTVTGRYHIPFLSAALENTVGRLGDALFASLIRLLKRTGSALEPAFDQLEGVAERIESAFPVLALIAGFAYLLWRIGVPTKDYGFNWQSLSATESTSPLGSWVHPQTVRVDENGAIEIGSDSFLAGSQMTVIPKQKIASVTLEQGWLWNTVSIDCGLLCGYRLWFKKDNNALRTKYLLSAALGDKRSFDRWKVREAFTPTPGCNSDLACDKFANLSSSRQ